VPAYNATAAFGSDAIVERGFLRQVFTWMFLALALTTGVALWFHHIITISYLARHQTLFFVALFAQLGLVLVLRGVVRSDRVSAQVAAFLFFLYAALVGVVFTILLDVYTTKSIIGAFAGAAGVFAGMALVGYTTQMDLSRLGPILFGALIGLIAASFAYIFIGGSTLNLVIGCVGVVLFSALTAYDMQNLKQMRISGMGAGGGQSTEKLAIYGALRLYLDFINLFISLLRIFGGQR
jgi:FtsH-binding integral membrane protein